MKNMFVRLFTFYNYSIMYVAPALRNEVHYEITNLCDEFLHIDNTPEANMQEYCITCSCARKSVTCIATVTKDDFRIYSCIYNNF